MNIHSINHNRQFTSHVCLRKIRVAAIGVFLLGAAAILPACGKNSSSTPVDNTQDPGKDTTGGQTVPPDPYKSIISDPEFNKGIAMLGDDPGNQINGKYIYPFGLNGTPVWELGEWASKYLIGQSDKTSEPDGTIVYQDTAKIISFKKEGTKLDIHFGLNGSAEYARPRKEGEPWPAFLLQQEFVDKPLIRSIDSLILFLEGRLVREELKMAPGDYNPDIHTSQFQLFLIVQDRNTLSPGYGDFLWFGIPFYDYRYRIIAPHYQQDFAVTDGTGKFIYSIGTTNLTDKSFQDGQWISVRLDLKPFIVEAIQKAKEHNFLPNSSQENMRISGMNIGWETPGTIDAEFEYKNFDLKYYQH